MNNVSKLKYLELVEKIFGKITFMYYTYEAQQRV